MVAQSPRPYGPPGMGMGGMGGMGMGMGGRGGFQGGRGRGRGRGGKDPLQYASVIIKGGMFKGMGRALGACMLVDVCHFTVPWVQGCSDAVRHVCVCVLSGGAMMQGCGEAVWVRSQYAVRVDKAFDVVALVVRLTV